MKKGQVFICLFLWCFSASFLHASQPTLKVGIYNNAPKIFLTETKEPAGFFVDLLNAIADEQNWKLSYVPCEWDACLEKLEKGEIDIMPDVAYSKEREKRFMFNNEDVLSAWSVIYGNKGHTIISILDLHQKRVAVIKDAIQHKHLLEQTKLLGIEPVFIETQSFSDALNLLKLKKVDACVINKFFDVSAFSVQTTNIILNPVILKFAFSQEFPKDLKHALDTTLLIYKKNPNSPYFSAKNKWLDTTPSNPPLPKWVIYSGLFTLSALVVLLLLVAFFKHLLNSKIKEFKKQESVLIAQSRHAAMGEMISIIAHQWKQPLSILSMIANNVRMDAELDTLDTKSVIAYHENFTSQIGYLSHTIEDFRNFFKPNKEKQHFQDFNDILIKTLSLLEPVLRNRQIEVQTTFEKIEDVWLHSNELMQVLINILNNAKDAFEQNNVPNAILKLSTTLIDKSLICIEITDNAGGIDEAIIGKIFEPYFSTKEKRNGTGLGLYICKVIVEEHFKGSLNVHVHNDLSTFVLHLPLKEMHEQAS